MNVVFNEIDPIACAVLRECYEGTVLERSIKDLRPDDFAGYERAHFFAGAGLWEVACELAGWVGPIWTGSCPCQPFSVAGKGAGTDDPRHLWPDLFRLIDVCRPPVVVGEQVSNATGKVDRVDEDMQHLWRAEDVRGFLSSNGVARQFDWLSCALQRLQQSVGDEIPGWVEDAAVGYTQEVLREEPSKSSDNARETSRQDSELGVRPRRVRGPDTESHRQRVLRGERDAVSPGRRSNLGQPVAGPHRPETRIHSNERSSSSVRPECDDEHLGRGQDFGDRRCDESQTSGGAEPPTSKMGDTAEREVGESWLDGVRADLESIGYAFRAVDIPACAVDAPHKRNRIYWVAVDNSDVARRLQPEGSVGALGRRSSDANVRSGVADADRCGRDGRAQDPLGSAGRRDAAERPASELGDADGRRHPQGRSSAEVGKERRSTLSANDFGLGHPHATRLALGRSERSDDGAQRSSAQRANGSFWSDAEWLRCADGKARRSKPGLRLLVDGLVGRSDLWRLAGNSIVPQVAAEVLIALKETLDEVRPVRVNDLFG